MGVKIDIGILSRAGLTRPWLEQMYGSLSGTLHSIGLTKLMQFLITSQIPSLRQDITLLLILRAAGDDAWRVHRRNTLREQTTNFLVTTCSPRRIKCWAQR